MSVQKVSGFLFILFGVAVSTSQATASAFETLKAKIISEKADSVEKVLSLLPEKLRSHYALVFRTRSVQGASYESPRVIMYGEDAKFVVAFNGSPNQRGYNELEFVEFDSEKKQFSYYEVLFPEKSTGRNQTRFSDANPAKCQRCHGNPTRPIWDTHPAWPGAYGQVYHADLAKSEAEGLTHFLALQPNHARYRYLANLQTFSNRETFAPTTLTRYEARDHVLPPNAALGELLAELNFQMLAKEIASNAEFSVFQYALMAALDNECGNIESYFPAGLKPEVAKRLAQFNKNTAVQNALVAEAKTNRLRELGVGFVPESDHVDLAPFRFVAEAGLGVSTDSWTMALEKNSFDFTGPHGAAKRVEKAVSGYAFKNEPALRHLFSLRDVSNEDQYCGALKTKSLASIVKLHEIPEERRISAEPMQTGSPALIAKCMSCHEGTVGYALPFDKPQQLAKVLAKGEYPRGHLLDEILYRLSEKTGADSMPRGIAVSADERRGLVDYFQRMAVAEKPQDSSRKP